MGTEPLADRGSVAACGPKARTVFKMILLDFNSGVKISFYK